VSVHERVSMPVCFRRATLQASQRTGGGGPQQKSAVARPWEAGRREDGCPAAGGATQARLNLPGGILRQLELAAPEKLRSTSAGLQRKP